MIFHHPSWKLRCRNSSSASTKHECHLSCDVLFHDTGLTISATLIRFFLTVHSRREFMPNISWYIMAPFSLSVVQNTSLLYIPHRWLISTDWHQKIILMTGRCCLIHVSPKVCCPYSIVFEVTAEAFSIHSCYINAIWFYPPHSSTGETFHL